MLHWFLLFGVAEQGILVKKPFRSYVRGFTTQANYYRTNYKVAQEYRPRQKPPTRTAAKTTRHYNSWYFCDFKIVLKHVMRTPFYFLWLLWDPLGTARSLGKTPTFGPATPTGHPDPAKSVLLLGNDPKSFCRHFTKIVRSPLCGLLRNLFKDFGFHQRLLKETSLKVLGFYF